MFIPNSLPQVQWVSRGQNIELSGHLEEISSKLHSQMSTENDEKHYILSPNLLHVPPPPKKKEEKRATTDSSCILLRVGGLKTARRWEQNERESERAVGQITDVYGVHIDFMKLISKQQLEEKARQRHMRTAAEREWEMQST